VASLEQLRRHIPGPMTALWDRGHVHDRSKVVRAYLAEPPEIVTEKFPGHAPETDPDEMVWQHAKHARLSNSTPEDVVELRATVAAELERLHGKPGLLSAFIHHAKVPIRLQVASR
jgi:hypothetical protein